jgi:nucleotide-binding universal stress UspA family protein
VRKRAAESLAAHFAGVLSAPSSPYPIRNRRLPARPARQLLDNPSVREGYDMLELNTLLVPLDFSPISEGVYDTALELVRGDDAALILLHAIDPALVEFAASLEVQPREKIVATMRARAEEALATLKERAAGRVEVQTIVSEGIPFVEILRKAEDFQVDAVLMGKHGMRGHIEKLLFGTTAERVIRGTSRAVIVIPVDT